MSTHVEPQPALRLVVAAKLRASRPRRPLVPRPRLLEAVRGRPIVLLVADAGYGKSSFLSDWARPYGRVVWYALDERDRDPTSFGQHLLAAAGAAPATVRGWRGESADAADALAARVLELTGAHTAPVGLVLDDAHLVAESELVQSTLRRLLADRPAALRIAIASREPLPLPLGRWRAQAALAELGASELAFTRAEAAMALAATPLSEADLDALVSLTGGWPAAVQLVGEAWASGARPRAPLATRQLARATAFDAFVEEEVLSRLAPADVELLARLSVVDEIDPDVCAALAGEQALDRLNDLAERFSFLAEATAASGSTLRIHPLVRRILSRRLNPAERRAALGQAATTFERDGRPIEAGRAAIALDDHVRLCGLLLRESTRLVAEGRARTLAEWWSHLPLEVIERDPALLARRAHLEGVLGNLAAATRLFEQAVNGFLEAGQPRAAADVLRVLAGLCDERGAYEQARVALDRAVALLPADDPLLSVPLNSQLAVILLHAGEPHGALTLARQVVERARASGSPPVLVALAEHNLGLVLSTLGRFGEAEQALLRALELKRQAGLSGSQALSLNSLGLVYQRQGRLGEAETTLDEALRLAADHGLPAVEAYALSNVGDVYRLRGELARAEAAYRQSLAKKEALGSQFGLAHTWNCLAAMARQTGDLERARAHNQQALDLRAGDADPIERLLYRAEAGRIELAEGAFEAAHTTLTHVARELQRLGAAYDALRTAWSAAVAAWRLDGIIDGDVRALLHPEGDEPYWLDDLVAVDPAVAVAAWAAGGRGAWLAAALVGQSERVLPIIEAALGRRNSPQQPADLARRDGPQQAALIELLPRLAGNGPLRCLVEVERAGGAAARRAAGATLGRLRTMPPPPLAVSGLGPLRVERRGRSIPERAWRRQGALELLGLLLLAGPAGRRRDELIVDCWPEARAEAGVEQFHAHLHALRGALEPEAARGTWRYVLGEGRVYRLAFEHIARWDVGVFEQALEDARAAEARGALEAAEAAYATASQTFGGLLFDGLAPDGEWLEIARERLRQQALEARVRLARLRQQRGDPLAARQAWSLVLALDPLREDAQRGLLEVLHGLGERDEALAQFRQYTALLRRELDAVPSRELEALYREILAS